MELVVNNESWYNQADIFLIIELWSPISTFFDEKIKKINNFLIILVSWPYIHIPKFVVQKWARPIKKRRQGCPRPTDFCTFLDRLEYFLTRTGHPEIGNHIRTQHSHYQNLWKKIIFIKQKLWTLTKHFLDFWPKIWLNFYDYYN